jgi:hypothetical protein
MRLRLFLPREVEMASGTDTIADRCLSLLSRSCIGRIVCSIIMFSSLGYRAAALFLVHDVSFARDNSLTFGDSALCVEGAEFDFDIAIGSSSAVQPISGSRYRGRLRSNQRTQCFVPLVPGVMTASADRSPTGKTVV